MLMCHSREKVEKRLESHLRLIARQLLRFDTKEEVLKHLTDSFKTECKCDFVGVFLKEGEQIFPKAWIGNFLSLKASFPLMLEECSQKLFQKSLTYNDVIELQSCKFINLLKKEKIICWFTVPITDNTITYGFCTVGYIKHVSLLELYDIFDEFGKDLGIALSLVSQKETERKKMLQMEWMGQKFPIDESEENIIRKIVHRAGNETRATFAGIYIYNSEKNQFDFQYPSYGQLTKTEIISNKGNYELKNYFPFLESFGGNQLTVPLIIDLKTIGVLHVEHKGNVAFTQDDLERLDLYANHVSTILENTLRSKHEKNQKERLYSLLNYQQDFMKKTIEQEDFDGITSSVCKIFLKPVILFDRFIRPISYQFPCEENIQLENTRKIIFDEVDRRVNKDVRLSLKNIDGREILVLPVNGGGDLLGYLALFINHEEMDYINQLTVELIRNIYSIQFIKQKWVFNIKEQVRESFINKLLVEDIEDKESIIQYANLFRWDLFKQHRVAVLSIQLNQEGIKDSDILKRKTKIALILEQLKIKISMYDRDLLLAKVKEVPVIIASVEKEQKDTRFWSNLLKNIKKWLKADGIESKTYIGIGGKADSLEDYFSCYHQAIQTLNVISQRDYKSGYEFFENLGSYTLLHHLKDTMAASSFINKYLDELINYSDKKGGDLFHTLRIYLEHNGNIPSAAEELFIHRSTLTYRLEKIESIIGMSLTNSEIRFNLLLAYKLYDLYKTTAKYE